MSVWCSPESSEWAVLPAAIGLCGAARDITHFNPRFFFVYIEEDPIVSHTQTKTRDAAFERDHATGKRIFSEIS